MIEQKSKQKVIPPYVYNRPLHLQNISLLEFINYLNERKWIKKNTIVRLTKKEDGFLLKCPLCSKAQKLYFGLRGKMFVCLDSDCGFTSHNILLVRGIFLKQQKQIQRWEEFIKQNKNKKRWFFNSPPFAIDNGKYRKSYEMYVDYALHSSIGIWCLDLKIRETIRPEVKIKWQIEGEALAIKMGIECFLNKVPTDIPKENVKLLLYTDCKTLLRPFQSKTNAGKWWNEGIELAKQSGIGLELRFVRGARNLADVLTRSTALVKRMAKRDKNYYKDKWKEKHKLNSSLTNSKSQHQLEISKRKHTILTETLANSKIIKTTIRK